MKLRMKELTLKKPLKKRMFICTSFLFVLERYKKHTVRSNLLDISLSTAQTKEVWRHKLYLRECENRCVIFG